MKSGEYCIVSCIEQFVCLLMALFPISEQSEGRVCDIMKFYELQTNGDPPGADTGAICCECVPVRALGMFLALCFRINTCCGPASHLPSRSHTSRRYLGIWI